MESTLKSSASIKEAIEACEMELHQARNSTSPLEQRRRPLLLANDSNGLSKLDADLSALLQTESRCIERIALLREELARAEIEERAAELDQLHEKTNRLRVIGEQLIKEYDRQAPKLVDILKKLSAIDSHIEKANSILGDRRVASPNEVRMEPVIVMPARTELVEERAEGVYDGSGHPTTTDIRAPRMIEKHIPEERRGGTRPDMLWESAFIPQGLWGSPWWRGAGKAYNPGPNGHHSGSSPDNNWIIEDLLKQG